MIHFSKNFFAGYFLALTILILASCKTKEKPVTQPEALVFGKTVQASIKNKKGLVLDNAFDTDALLERMDVPNKKSLLSQRGFKEGMGDNLKMGTLILNSLGKDGSYEMLNQYARGDTQHVVFRLYANGNLNYHDMELVNVKGKCKIADVYIYLSGEKFSETLVNIYRHLDVSKGVTDKDLTAMKKVADIRKLIQAQDYTTAKSELENLPAHIQAMKAVQLYYVLLAQGIGDEPGYNDAIANYERLYPNEPNMFLLQIHGYFTQKKYAKAIEAIDKLDAALDKDPILDYHRSLIYKTMGDMEEQKKSLDRLVKNMPNFESGALEMVTYYLDKDDNTNAGIAIADFKMHKDFDIETLDAIIEQYPGYKAR